MSASAGEDLDLRWIELRLAVRFQVTMGKM
jgi:hypothetical protein